MPKIRGAIKNGCCYCIDNQVDNTAYGSSWNGKCDKAPSQNSVYAKFEGIKQFTPSNTGSSGQMLQKTSSGYSRCTVNSGGIPCNKMPYCAGMSGYGECTYTTPTNGYLRYSGQGAGYQSSDYVARLYICGATSGYITVIDTCSTGPYGCPRTGAIFVPKGTKIYSCRGGSNCCGLSRYFYGLTD